MTNSLIDEYVWKFKYWRASRNLKRTMHDLWAIQRTMRSPTIKAAIDDAVEYIHFARELIP